MILLLVLAQSASAAMPLPSYRDDLALAAWHAVNEMIENACVKDRGGGQYCHAEDLDEAISEADRFQKNLFPDARLEYLAGLALKLQDKSDAAAGRYETSVGMDPDRQDAWHDLGEIRMAQGRFDDAEKAFNEVDRLVKNGRHSWIGPWRLAEVAAHRGDPVAFEKHMKLALERGFSFRQIRGLPNWKKFYADPTMHDSVDKLITVYGDDSIRESLQ